MAVIYNFGNCCGYINIATHFYKVHLLTTPLMGLDTESTETNFPLESLPGMPTVCWSRVEACVLKLLNSVSADCKFLKAPALPSFNSFAFYFISKGNFFRSLRYGFGPV